MKGGQKQSSRGEGKREGELKGIRCSGQRRMERESKKKDVLIEGATIELVARSLALENFPVIHKDDPT